MTEQTAIRLCLIKRDPRGFEYLVGQFRREAFYHAHALLGNEADAADACQEAFACAFAAMPKLTQLDKFYPWFYRILKNRCLNMIARRKTRETHAACEWEQSGSSARHDVTPNPASILEAQEARHHVWHLLDSLNDKHREILTLKYIHGFRYDEISATLGIPRGTVMSRLHAARDAFRTLHQQSSESGAPHLQTSH